MNKITVIKNHNLSKIYKSCIFIYVNFRYTCYRVKYNLRNSRLQWRFPRPPGVASSGCLRRNPPPSAAFLLKQKEKNLKTQMVLKLPQTHEGSEYVLSFEIEQREGGFYSVRTNTQTEPPSSALLYRLINVSL